MKTYAIRQEAPGDTLIMKFRSDLVALGLQEDKEWNEMFLSWGAPATWVRVGPADRFSADNGISLFGLWPEPLYEERTLKPSNYDSIISEVFVENQAACDLNTGQDSI